MTNLTCSTNSTRKVIIHKKTIICQTDNNILPNPLKKKNNTKYDFTI